MPPLPTWQNCHELWIKKRKRQLKDAVHPPAKSMKLDVSKPTTKAQPEKAKVIRTPDGDAPAGVAREKTPNDDCYSSSTPVKDDASPSQEETDVFKYVDKIAHLILNNLPLRLKHLVKLQRLEQVSEP